MIRDRNKLKNIEEANKKLESVWLDNKIVEGHKKDVKKYLKGEYPDQNTRNSEYEKMVKPHSSKLSRKQQLKTLNKRYPEGEDHSTTTGNILTDDALMGKIEEKYGEKLRSFFQTEWDLLDQINEEFGSEGDFFFFAIKGEVENKHYEKENNQ